MIKKITQMPFTRSMRKTKIRRSLSFLSIDKISETRRLRKDYTLFSLQDRTDTIFSSQSAGLDSNTNSWLNWRWILYLRLPKRWFCQGCQPGSQPLNIQRKLLRSLWTSVKCLQGWWKPKQTLDSKEMSRSCWRLLLASSLNQQALLLTNTPKTTTWNARQMPAIFRASSRTKDSVWTPFQTRANTLQVLQNTSQLSLALICQTSLARHTRMPIYLIRKLRHPNNKSSVLLIKVPSNLKSSKTLRASTPQRDYLSNGRLSLSTNMIWMSKVLYISSALLARNVSGSTLTLQTLSKLLLAASVQDPSKISWAVSQPTVEPITNHSASLVSI